MPKLMLDLNATPMFLFGAGVFLVQMGVGVAELATRAMLAPNDAGRYGGEVNWMLDVSSLTWLCCVYHAAVRCYYSFRHLFRENVALERISREDEIPIAARVDRFAVAFFVPTAIVQMVAYAIYANTGHHARDLTMAYFSMNTVCALLELVLCNTRMQPEHLAWVLLAGFIYLVPITLLFYMFHLREEELTYVYGAVDWSNPGGALVGVIELAIATAAVYAAASVVAAARSGKVYGTLTEQEAEAVSFTGSDMIDVEKLVASGSEV